ncbi:GAF domain-containing protein [candidate division WOR-3 bacterium]|nr:GAF domain-containing protein [candidate division WOR-3 bacterium]
MYYTEKEVADLIDEVKQIMEDEGNNEEKLHAVCVLLEKRVQHYDWVGFYIADEEKRILTLGPFVGEPTEHTRIAFGQGICGQAADIKKPFVIQDVRKETNYLSCSVKVMSEIVMPVFKEDAIVGELDIDSHTVSPFSERDTMLLEQVCELVAPLF